jgi:hypothetical protein
MLILFMLTAYDFKYVRKVNGGYLKKRKFFRAILFVCQCAVCVYLVPMQLHMRSVCVYLVPMRLRMRVRTK